jgi:cobalt/nickel transport protein
MNKFIFLTLLATLFTLSAQNCPAHFGMLIPERSVVTQEKKNIQFNLAFAHPFENIGMELVKPETFSVTVDGQTTDLTDTLQPAAFMQHNSWKTSFAFKKPGVYHFTMEPTPYWEPGEDVSIIHYTKTIIGAYGDDQGWDTPVGLPTEIIPLLRPFGNYAGNSFTGQVLLGGKPAAGTLVEVELYNVDNELRAPNDYHITQVVKTDDNGVFNFTCPLPGWWGFAALHEADYTIKDPKGNEKGVEIGAVLWIYLDELPGKRK